MRWERGRAVVDQLLTESKLQRAPASRAQADLLVTDLDGHVVDATRCC